MHRNKKLVIVVLLLLLSLLPLGCSEVASESIRIAIPYEEHLAELQESYYFNWLESQSDLSIEIIFIPKAHSYEYMEIIFSGELGNIDAVFFSDQTAPSNEEITEYGKNGDILCLNELIEEQGSELSALFSDYELFNLKAAISTHEGEMYYVPQLVNNLPKNYEQTMWINLDWLEELGLNIPEDTESLRTVLTEFNNEFVFCAPIIGSLEQSGYNSMNFIMNSFTIAQPSTGYFALDGDEVFFPPTTNEWREGLSYLAELYDEGLIVDENFTYNVEQLVSLCNDPRLNVGVFTANELSDIISVHSPEMLNHYISVQPLSHNGENGYAVVEVSPPKPGGIILSSSEKAEQVFSLMDIMCSEQAYLFGHYGEPGVDFEPAKVGDISVSGTPALITVKSDNSVVRDGGVPDVFGPFVARDNYAQAVAWKGYQVNQTEYIEVRASIAYESFEYPYTLSPLVYNSLVQQRQNTVENLIKYTENKMIEFITGEKDIEDDTDWQVYLLQFSDYGLDEITQLMQKEHERLT